MSVESIAPERGWTDRPLRHWFQSIFGGTWGSDPGADAHDLRCIRGTDFDFDRLVSKDDAPTRSVSALDVERRALRVGDLVIEKSGGGFQQFVGRAVRFVGTEASVPTNFAAGLRCDDDVSPRFAVYVLRSLYGLGTNRRWVNQTTGIQNLDLGGYLTERVPCPVLEEQRRIADFLDAETARIDALIAAKQQMITTAALRLRVRAETLLLRGQDPMARGGVGLSGTLRPKLLRVCSLQRGHDLPADKRVPGGVPVISSGGVSGSHDQPMAEPPGVVTGRYGTVGQVFFSETPYWPLNTTLYVTDFHSNHPRWVYWLLKCLPLNAESEKSAVGGINRNVIGELRVEIPSLPEQVMTADLLDREDSELQTVTSILTRQVELLRERRQALITAAVSGEMTV